MIKTCVMQPYLFPYLGYWQMLAAVDNFVIFDDVNFINKGWINRNNILLNGKPYMITLPLVKASQNKLINEVDVLSDLKAREKILKTLTNAYRKAPFFYKVYPILETVFLNEEPNLVLFLKYQFDLIFSYLEISTKILVSSGIEKNNSLKGEKKIIEICKSLNTNLYINSIGGLDLYSHSSFEKNGMDLKFIKMRSVRYSQFNEEFVPFLSFIDVLMFNDVEAVGRLLKEYDFV